MRRASPAAASYDRGAGASRAERERAVPRAAGAVPVLPPVPGRRCRRPAAAMLALLSRLLDWFRSLFWKEEMELTLVGLQYSGKTTFVNVIAVSGRNGERGAGRAAALSLRHRGAARPAGGLQGRGCGRRGAGPGACLSSVGLQAVHAVTSGVIGRFPRWIVSVFVGKWFKRFALRCPSFF